MNNKGFTLIELIGTIVILSLLLLIISPLVTRSIKEGTNKADEQIKTNIELAAKNWASDNKGLLPSSKDENYKVKISELQNQGYLDDNIKLPQNDTNPDEVCVIITKTNENTNTSKKVYKYEYNNSCN